MEAYLSEPPDVSMDPERLERLVFLVPERYLAHILHLALDRPPSSERDRTLARLVRRFASLGCVDELVAVFTAIQQTSRQISTLELDLSNLDAPTLLLMLEGFETQQIWQDSWFQNLYPQLILHLVRTAGDEKAVSVVRKHVQAGLLNWESLFSGIHNVTDPSPLIPVINELLPCIPDELKQTAHEIPGMVPLPEGDVDQKYTQQPPLFDNWDDSISYWSARVKAIPKTKLDQHLLEYFGDLIASNDGSRNDYIVWNLIKYLPEFCPEHRRMLFDLLVLESNLETSDLLSTVLASAIPELIQGSSVRVRNKLGKMLHRVASTDPDSGSWYTRDSIKEFKLHTLELGEHSYLGSLVYALAERIDDQCDRLGWLGSRLDELDPSDAQRILEKLPDIVRKLRVDDYHLADCCSGWPNALRAALLKIVPDLRPDTYPCLAFICMLHDGVERELAFQNLLDIANESEGGDPFMAWIAAHLPEFGRTSQALAFVEKIWDVHIQSQILVAIADDLEESHLDYALSLARNMLGMAENPIEYDECERALAALALRAAVLGRNNQAVKLAWEIGSDHWRAQALRNIAPYLDEELLDLAWRAAQDMDFLNLRLSALGALALYLPEPQRTHQLEVFFNLAENQRIEDLIASTAHALPERLLPFVIQGADRVGGDYAKIVFEQLLPRLHGEEREALAWYLLSDAFWGIRRGGGGYPVLPYDNPPLSHAELAPVFDTNFHVIRTGDFDGEASDDRTLEELAISAEVEDDEAYRREDRYLQARIETQEHQVIQDEEPLLCSQTYLASVFIGARDPEWLGLDKPVNTPDQSDGNHLLLDVLFWEPTVCPKPQVKTLKLQPRGNTGIIHFPFRTTADQSDFCARIAVYHQNRNLQTGLLKGRVGDVPALLEFAIDAAPLPKFIGLADRAGFGASIIVDDDPSSEAEALIYRDGDAVVVDIPKTQNLEPVDITPSQTGSLESLTAALGRAITRITNTPEDYTDLSKEGSRKLLLELALHGSAILTYLRKHSQMGGHFDQVNHIQIVMAHVDAFLPIEYFYDGEAPEDDAKICDSTAAATSALKTGECCGAYEKDPTHTICPLRFWSLSKVIERHAHLPEHTRLSGQFQLRSTGKSARDRLLDPLHSGILAASQEADSAVPDTVKNLRSNLNETFRTHPVPLATDWASWANEIAKTNPSLLVLIPHHVQEGGFDSLEIGGDKRKSMQIRPEHVCSPQNPDSRPIVLLIGCKTNTTKIDLEGFVPAFQDAGAVIIVSTIASILGRQAGPAAAAIVEEIEKQGEDPDATFGEVMLAVRRRLLAEGTPMVLGLTSYGDADWRIGTTEDDDQP